MDSPEDMRRAWEAREADARVLDDALADVLDELVNGAPGPQPLGIPITGIRMHVRAQRPAWRRIFRKR